METVYLSRRNLLTLLSKLERVADGGFSTCTLIKADTKHLKYPCSSVTAVIAVEDCYYYNDREPGEIHPADERRI